MLLLKDIMESHQRLHIFHCVAKSRESPFHPVKIEAETSFSICQVESAFKRQREESYKVFIDVPIEHRRKTDQTGQMPRLV